MELKCLVSRFVVCPYLGTDGIPTSLRDENVWNVPIILVQSGLLWYIGYGMSIFSRVSPMASRRVSPTVNIRSVTNGGGERREEPVFIY